MVFVLALPLCKFRYIYTKFYLYISLISYTVSSINIFCLQGFRSDDMQAWRQHWNHQLYKALEYQYQKGLEALNKNLPEIQIDLIFK